MNQPNPHYNVQPACWGRDLTERVEFGVGFSLMGGGAELIWQCSHDHQKYIYYGHV